MSPAVIFSSRLTVGRPSRVQYNDVCFVVGHCPGRSFSVSPAVESCLRILLTERLIGPRPSVTDGPVLRLKKPMCQSDIEKMSLKSVSEIKKN